MATNNRCEKNSKIKEDKFVKNTSNNIDLKNKKIKKFKERTNKL